MIQDVEVSLIWGSPWQKPSMDQPANELLDGLQRRHGCEVQLILEFELLEGELKVESNELMEDGRLRRLLICDEDEQEQIVEGLYAFEVEIETDDLIDKENSCFGKCKNGILRQ